MGATYNKKMTGESVKSANALTKLGLVHKQHKYKQFLFMLFSNADFSLINVCNKKSKVKHQIKYRCF